MHLQPLNIWQSRQEGGQNMDLVFGTQMLGCLLIAWWEWPLGRGTRMQGFVELITNFGLGGSTFLFNSLGSSEMPWSLVGNPLIFLVLISYLFVHVKKSNLSRERISIDMEVRTPSASLPILSSPQATAFKHSYFFFRIYPCGSN